jgi:cytosine/adenosine deaminase-related metal-dependent hydrolase
VEAGNLPSALVFASGSGVVAGTWVDGRKIYARGDTSG